MSNGNSRSRRLLGHVNGLDWILLLLVLPLVLFPTPLRLLGLLIIPALWLIRRMAAGQMIPATPLNWPLFGLLLMVLVSAYATPDLEASMPKMAGTLFGMAIFLEVAARAGGSIRRLWLGVGLLLACGWGVVAVSLLSTRWSSKLPLLRQIAARLPQPSVSMPGAIDGFINPNEIAGVLLWITPLALVLAWQLLRNRAALKDRLPARQAVAAVIYLLSSALLLLAALIVAQSRGGLLGLAAALLFIGVVKIRWSRRRVLAITGLLLLLGAGGGLIAGPETFSGLLFGGGEELAGSAVNTLQGRLEIWSRALYGIQDFPITGMGMNSFRRVVHILYPLFLIAPNVDIAHAHNHLLQTALDLGIPGLIAYFALWMGAAAMLWQTWRATGDLWLRSLALGFAASLLGYFVYGLTDAVALGARPGFIFWLLLGLVASLHRLVVVPAAADGSGAADSHGLVIPTADGEISPPV